VAADGAAAALADAVGASPLVLSALDDVANDIDDATDVDEDDDDDDVDVDDVDEDALDVALLVAACDASPKLLTATLTSLVCGSNSLQRTCKHTQQTRRTLTVV
jgi:hypothetical protein